MLHSPWMLIVYICALLLLFYRFLFGGNYPGGPSAA